MDLDATGLKKSISSCADNIWTRNHDSMQTIMHQSKRQHLYFVNVIDKHCANKDYLNLNWACNWCNWSNTVMYCNQCQAVMHYEMFGYAYATRCCEKDQYNTQSLVVCTFCVCIRCTPNSIFSFQIHQHCNALYMSLQVLARC